MGILSKFWDKVTGTEKESHERECKALYKSIDKRLEDGSKRFDKLENMIWAVYPFIVGAIVIAELI